MEEKAETYQVRFFVRGVIGVKVRAGSFDEAVEKGRERVKRTLWAKDLELVDEEVAERIKLDKLEEVGEGTWKSGTPTTPGWYNASKTKNGRLLRWWDGTAWSRCVVPENDIRTVSKWASLRDIRKGIWWRPLRKELRPRATEEVTGGPVQR